MRIYELAKLLEITSKDVIAVLKKKDNNFNGTHMSVLSPEEVDSVESSVKKIDEVDNLNLEIASVNKKNKNPQPEAAKSSAKFVISSMTVLEFCEKTNLAINQVVLDFLKSGKLYGINQVLSKDEVRDAASRYEIATSDALAAAVDSGLSLDVSSGDKRFPIVVVVGHVDHGKTTLLDFIRSTRVAQKEKGGITQHLGAYQVSTKHGSLVFLDTPGHEAFSLMRSRGVRVADLVILVVAADDGVKPQTIEAINTAVSMDVPVIVAINKVDRVDASRIEAVKSELSQYGLVAEDWGGQVIMAPISAKTGAGVDELLEMIVLQSEVMDLKANVDSKAIGYVLESHIEKGRGRVATFISQNGTMHTGDYFICGKTHGRISVLIDSSGKTVKSVGPSEPVKIAGLDELPRAGDVLKVVDQVEYKMFSKKAFDLEKPVYASIDSTNVIIKAYNDSSREAIVNEINKKFASNGVRVISSSIGSATYADVELAASCKATIYAFGVKFDTGAEGLARQLNVKNKTFYIIYQLLDDIAEEIESNKEIIKVRKKQGSAFVKKTFKAKDIGVIAGVQI